MAYLIIVHWVKCISATIDYSKVWPYFTKTVGLQTVTLLWVEQQDEAARNRRSRTRTTICAYTGITKVLLASWSTSLCPVRQSNGTYAEERRSCGWISMVGIAFACCSCTFTLHPPYGKKKSLTTVTKGTCFTISMYLVVPCPIEFNFEFNAKAV